MRTSKKDHIRNAVVAGANLIPVAGGILGVILDKYLPSELETRKNRLIEDISNDLEEVKEKVSVDWLQSPDFISIFMKAFRGAIEENRHEKIISFRNILINTAISETDEFDEVTFYIRLVNDLTVDQIRVLHHVYSGRIEGGFDTKNENNVYREFQNIWPAVDQSYLMACITELIRFNLISSSNKLLKEKKTNKGHVLTGFGERFVKYIFSPIQISPN